MRQHLHLSVRPSIATSEPTAIDCATCPASHGPACDDCIVSFLTGPETVVAETAGADAVVVDVSEARALRLLSQAGLLGEVVERRPATSRMSVRVLGRPA